MKRLFLVSVLLSLIISPLAQAADPEMAKWHGLEGLVFTVTEQDEELRSLLEDTAYTGAKSELPNLDISTDLSKVTTGYFLAEISINRRLDRGSWFGTIDLQVARIAQNMVGEWFFAAIYSRGTLFRYPDSTLRNNLVDKVEQLVQNLVKDINTFAPGGQTNELMDLAELIRNGAEAYDSENWADAISYYTKALEIDAQNAAILCDIGTAYWHLLPQMPDTAIDYFDRATSIDPTFVSAYYNKGIVLLYGQGQPMEALESFNQALALNPPEAYLEQIIEQIACAQEQLQGNV